MDVHGKRVTTEILTSNIIPIFPLPVVDDLPSELGNSGMFSATDWISGFFQCAINKDSIPLTAYSRWTVGMDIMSQEFASSPGWLQSIVSQVREGLERVKLFIDDLVCSPKTGNSMCTTCNGPPNG